MRRRREGEEGEPNGRTLATVSPAANIVERKLLQNGLFFCPLLGNIGGGLISVWECRWVLKEHMWLKEGGTDEHTLDS